MVVKKMWLAGGTSKVGRRLVTNRRLRQARPLYQPPAASGRTRSQISPHHHHSHDHEHLMAKGRAG